MLTGENFRKAFSSAKNKGQKTFTYNGKKYTTTTASEKAKKQNWVENIDSANKAAVASIVVGIVFTDLSTAIATFNGMFYASIEQQFGRALECIGADLWVSTEYTSDWH